MTNGDLMVGMLAMFLSLEVIFWWNVVAGPRRIRLPSLYGAVLALIVGAIVGSTFAQSGAFDASYLSSPASREYVFIVGAYLTVAGGVLTYRISGALQRRRRL